MSSAVNLRIDPRTGVSNWVGPITEGNGDAEFDVAEFPELPGVYGVILTQRPHPTDIEVYLTSDPSNQLTRVRKVTEPASDEFWSDSDQRNPRGYIIVNSSLVGQNLTIVYKAGGYLAHKRVLETVIPQGPPGPAGGVDSVFGRSGNVTAQSGDYNLDQISDGTTNKAFTATEKTKLAGMGSGANVSSVFGRSGAITAAAGDYAAFYALVKPQCEWRADTHAGYGSTDTKIPYFTNVRVNVDTAGAITVTNNSTNGCKVVINTADYYTFSFNMSPSSAAYAGISINSNQLTTDIANINVQNRLALTYIPATNTGHVSVRLYCAANDVVRPHGGVAADTAAFSNFSVTRG